MAEIRILRRTDKMKKDEFYSSLSIDTFNLLLNNINNNENMSRVNVSFSRRGGVA